MVNVCLSIHLELLTPIQLWLAVTFLPTLNKPHRHSNLHPPLGGWFMETHKQLNFSNRLDGYIRFTQQTDKTDR